MAQLAGVPLARQSAKRVHPLRAAILTWCARWYGQSDLGEPGWRFSFFGSGDDDSRRRAAASAKASLELFSAETSFATSFAHFFVFPTLGYLAWQCAYLLKTELWDVKRLDEDPELVTSLRWLANDYKAGVTRFALRVGRAIGAFGKEELFDAGSLKTKFVFVTLQLVYTVVTFVPIPLCYRSKTAHTSLMLLAFLSCIWNGAEYYIDIFSRRYARKFEEDVPYGATVRDEDEADAQVDERLRGSGKKELLSRRRRLRRRRLRRRRLCRRAVGGDEFSFLVKRVQQMIATAGS